MRDLGVEAATVIVGVEATSLIGPRSGVGHTTASIVEALVGIDEGDRGRPASRSASAAADG